MVEEWGKSPALVPSWPSQGRVAAGRGEREGRTGKAKWNGKDTPLLLNWPGPCPSRGTGPPPLYQVENKAIMSLRFGM